MSMKSWTEYGFGYPLFNDSNEGKIREFLAVNIPELSKQILKADYIENVMDILDMDISCEIAEIINRLEGKNLFYGYPNCGDTDQEEMLGISPAYPWQLKPEDMITKEEATSLLKKYADILGITDEPDYFEAEYFG